MLAVALDNQMEEIENQEIDSTEKEDMIVITLSASVPTSIDVSFISIYDQ